MPSGDFHNTFLGGTRKSISDPWKWEDGNLVEFDNFAEGHRDNLGQFCLYMHFGTGSKFMDIDCTNTHVDGVICQRKNAGITYYR